MQQWLMAWTSLPPQPTPPLSLFLSPLPAPHPPHKSSLHVVSSIHLPTIHHSHFCTHTHTSCQVMSCLPSPPHFSPELYCMSDTHGLTQNQIKKISLFSCVVLYVLSHNPFSSFSLALSLFPAHISIVRHTCCDPCLSDGLLLLFLL